MKEYTVTAIRYVIGRGLPFEERSRLAIEFVKGLRIGTEAILQAEPDNPADPNAVLVFIDDEPCGRIGKEQCLEVKGLLDDNMQARAVVSRNNEDKAFFVTIPGAENRKLTLPPDRRQLPASPLGEGLRMQFSMDEKTLDMLGVRLASMEVTRESAPDFIRSAERYLKLAGRTICYCDERRLSLIMEKLNLLCKNGDNFEFYEGLRETAERLRSGLHEKVRAMHRRWNKNVERTFLSHFDSLRADCELTQNLYKKYYEAFLCKKDFAHADKERMARERERLLKWFAEMEWCELRDPENLEQMALKLNYLRVSRAEIYDVYGVLLVLERLNEQLQDYVPAPLPSASSGKTAKVAKSPKKTQRKTRDKPLTLRYYTHDNNGLLMKQRERVDKLFQMWTKLGWIDSDVMPEDFDAFFEGKPRSCNITWTANSTILTILLQELLKQPYIEKQTGCSAKSLVKNQFGKTPNSDKSRLDEVAWRMIALSLNILNLDNPLSERNSRDDDYTQEDAYYNMYSDDLRFTNSLTR